MRFLPPAGTPLKTTDLAYGIRFSRDGRSDALHKFENDIKAGFGVRHCFFASTGRAAMCLVFAALYELSGRTRDEVILPSYTCFSVPSSVAKAGLKIRVCDVDPNTLDYDYGALDSIDFSKVLCLVTSNLYGIPNDLPRLRTLARERSVYLVDDAAQSMGARVDGVWSGTLGDVGIYSLDKGKNITSMEGGVIVTDSDEIAGLIRSRLAILEGPGVKERAVILIKLLLYWMFLRPSLYWIPGSLPFLGLGGTVYDESYPIGLYDGALAGVAMSLFHRLDHITGQRARNACRYRASLAGRKNLHFPSVGEMVEPAYLRFPVLLVSRTARDGALSRLNKRRLGASSSYPAPLQEIPEIRDLITGIHGRSNGGRMVADTILTLPTHPFVSQIDADQICEILMESR